MRISALCVLLAASQLNGCATQFAAPARDMTTMWAGQGWTNDERHWFHHAPQGTNTFGVPYEWLVGLEQPKLSLGEVGLLSDQAYLSRFGFIPSPVSIKDSATVTAYGYSADSRKSRYAAEDYNRANLPVGFAMGGEWVNTADGSRWPIPGTGRNARTVGLTCAACHTGQFEYEGKRVLVDGGAGMISLDDFREALALSMGFTKYVPGRFDRFAKRVLGKDYNDANAALLRQQFDALLDKGQKRAALEKSVADRAVVEGFTRLDALNRIGNQVFSVQMNRDENYHPITAPVSFPYIWNAPWFDWVQYNSSIQQPMVRNVGEAMGVAASVNLSNPGKTLYDSAIPANTIHEMELLLAGNDHPLKARRFGGLRSPRWAELPLPKLDPALVAKGRDLYMGAAGRKGLCAGCHLPPVDSEQIFDAAHWVEPGGGFTQKYLALVTIPVPEIGTDCKTAYDMAYRNVLTSDAIGNSGTLVRLAKAPTDCPQPPAEAQPPSGTQRTNFGVALGEVVEKTKQKWYDMHKIPSSERGALDGFRPNGIRATVKQGGEDLPVYKARPLNGTWATAPFLHNGSVPNLYLLLSTQAERDAEARKFYLGSREFDPKHVGYAYRADKSQALPDTPVLASTEGLFELDTRIVGNRNTGHLFTDEQLPGRIGPRLTAEERFALIEFLKSL